MTDFFDNCNTFFTNNNNNNNVVMNDFQDNTTATSASSQQQTAFFGNYFQKIENTDAFSTESISLMICYDGSNEKDLVPNINIRIHNTKGIELRSIVDALRAEAFPIMNSKILYFVPQENLFVFCGDEAKVNENSFLPMHALTQKAGSPTRTITLKIRRAIAPEQVNFYQQAMCQPYQATNVTTTNTSDHTNYQISEFDTSSYVESPVSNNMMNEPQQQVQQTVVDFAANEGPSFFQEFEQQLFTEISNDNNNNANSAQNVVSTTSDEKEYVERDTDAIEANGKRKRHAERTIREVQELVNYWRALHTGYVDKKTKKVVKLSLGEAANKVGVPRKSLDDYLLMMKHAKTNGFDFQANLEQRFGIVRNFVKKVKASKKNFDNTNANNSAFQGFNCEDDQDNEIKVNLSFTSKKINKFVNF